MELWVEREVHVCLVHNLEPEAHLNPLFLSLFYHMCFCCKLSQIFSVVRLDKKLTIGHLHLPQLVLDAEQDVK